MGFEGISNDGLQISAEAHSRDTLSEFTHAADLAVAARVLFWYKESGDKVRNSSKFTPAQMAQRKAILEVAHKVISMELNAALSTAFHSMRIEGMALAELVERLNGGQSP